MRLIRLYKDYNNQIPDGTVANFNNNFQSDIVLKPNSQIALLNIAIDKVNPILTIDNENNLIVWNLTTEDPDANEFSIAVGDYTENNINTLITSLQNGFNNTTGFDRTDTDDLLGYYLGVEWQVEIDADKKFRMKYRIGNLYWTELGKLNIATNVSNVAVDANRSSWYVAPPQNAYASASFEKSVISSNYIARGCGCVRSQVMLCDNNGLGAVESEGYIMALITDASKTPATLALADIKYGIHYTMTDPGAIREYWVILNGVRYGPATVAPIYTEGDTNNDVQEIMINNGQILFNIHQNSIDNPIELNVDGGIALPASGVVTYTAGQKLYPVMVFFGGQDYVEVDNFINTESPFQSGVTIARTNPTFSDAIQPTRLEEGVNDLEFETTEVAEWFGFDNRYMGPFPSGPGGLLRAKAYIADNVFDPVYYNDNFLVELKNISLDSYDGLKQQRKNVLAFISKLDETGQFNYETNTPIFIDLNNKRDILLRNVEANLLYGDYGEFTIQSDGSMTLLIKDKGE